MTTTVVETKINRKFTIQTGGWGADVNVQDTLSNDRVFSVLSPEQAKEVAAALLGDNATVVTDLPEAKDDGFGYVKAGHYDRSANTNADTVLANAKALLAIHAFITKRNEELEAAKIAEAEAAKAKEHARAKRRDELAAKFGTYASTYDGFSTLARKLVDQIIDHEEAAKVS